MAAIIATGHGASLALTTTSTWTPQIRSMTGFGPFEREVVDQSHLGTVARMKKQPGPLVDAGGFDIEFIFSSGDDVVTLFPPVSAVAEEVTIMLPDPADAFTTDAVLAGIGFFTGYNPPDLTSDGLMVSSARITWQGGAADEPEFVVAS